ncbi:MAG: hypothetical protein K9I68_00480 [Bacteroidales bacterium]|nr:hypothetical protein [Bacteroidales bacterium]MCF8336863.1 hypothetical protein [Bacteroidales bacterium]
MIRFIASRYTPFHSIAAAPRSYESFPDVTGAPHLDFGRAAFEAINITGAKAPFYFYAYDETISRSMRL